MWLKRITGLAANYLLWRVSHSKNEVIKMRTDCLSQLSPLALYLVFFFLFPL